MLMSALEIGGTGFIAALPARDLLARRGILVDADGHFPCIMRSCTSLCAAYIQGIA